VGAANAPISHDKPCARESPKKLNSGSKLRKSTKIYPYQIQKSLINHPWRKRLCSKVGLAAGFAITGKVTGIEAGQTIAVSATVLAVGSFTVDVAANALNVTGFVDGKLLVSASGADKAHNVASDTDQFGGINASVNPVPGGLDTAAAIDIRVISSTVHDRRLVPGIPDANRSHLPGSGCRSFFDPDEIRGAYSSRKSTSERTAAS
jgi:hypothetical protein